MSSTRFAANIVLVILALFVTFAMFITKNTVRDMEKELIAVNADIEKNIDAIHMLNVEWAYLNRPERIRELASKYTPLDDIKATQMVNYAALPFKYENSDTSRRMIAQRNLSNQAERNKSLKQLVKAQR